MKKTFTINIGGCPFTIDDDAYALLRNYLDTLQHAFELSEEDNELLTDIEMRMAEHFTQDTDSGRKIITFIMAEDVISRLGRPEEFIDAEILEEARGEETDASRQNSATPPNFSTEKDGSQIKHRLYRDPRGKILGGVCSGIAAYFDIDVIWVRIAVVASFFLSASVSILCYFILWAIVPVAKTPYQFMELEGNKPTLTNIGKTVTDAFRTPAPGETPTTGYSFINGCMKFVGFLVKFLMVLLALIAAPVLIALGAALVACLAALLAYAVAGTALLPLDIFSGYLPLSASPFVIILVAIAAILAIGIPFAVLVAIMINTYRQRTILSPAWGMVLGILWIVSLAACWIFNMVYLS
ncbi:MAG: PspC domain-containing protein [Bacteroidales bacterium]|nr:PspC domain-containing protein [Bacteroidales bacterium]